MNTRIPLVNFVILGQQLSYLSNPQISLVQTYFQEIRGFMQSLSDCDLQRTRQAAEPLGSTGLIYADHRGFINPAGVTYFNAMLATIRSVLYAEATEKQAIAINAGSVSQQLRDLRSALPLNASQRHLLDETILCLEAGADRAAMVMGWNLAYDFIRQWVYDNHLAAFNQELARNLDRTGNPAFDPVTAYHDFFASKPGEMKVIETCSAANIFSGRIGDDLRHHLRRRNDYAHRSFTTPSTDQAAAYIKELLDIITCPPFVVPT
jgi:hypothetical protein